MVAMTFKMQSGVQNLLWPGLACSWIALRASALPRHLAQHRTSEVTVDIVIITLYTVAGLLWAALYLRGRIELLANELRYRYFFSWTSIPYDSIHSVRTSKHGSGRVGSGSITLKMQGLSGSYPLYEKTLPIAEETDFVDELQRRAPHVALGRAQAPLSIAT